jgi:hypothetical protein
MEEVRIQLRFNRPCLGAAKRQENQRTIFRMDREPTGRVMFMPSAWQGVMRYAAKVANRHQALVKDIDWNPVIEGLPGREWRRTIMDGRRRTHYALHEAFMPGDVITVTAVLPDGMDRESFRKLMDIAGMYRGFSPFNNQTEKFGTFEVVSIEPTAPRKEKSPVV